MDFEATNASSQQKPKQMDEEFTTTAYPNVQENLKLPTEDQVILEEPASSTGTLSSLQNLDKDLSFTDQFFVEKPHEEESGKTNVETEVQSMVSVPIHQDTSSVPPITTPIIDLTTMQSNSPLPKSTATTSIITTTTSLPLPPQPQQSTADLILVSRIGELEQHMADLIQNNIALEERLDKQRTHLYNLENLNIPHKVSQAVDKTVTDVVDWAMQAPLRARFWDLPTSLELDYSNQHLADQEEARKKKRKKRTAPRTPSGSLAFPPPPPPPLAGASGAPSTSAIMQFESTGFTTTLELSLTDYLMQDDSISEEQVYLSDDEDSENDHQPKANSKKDWWKPLPKGERPTTPEPAWTIPSSNKSDVVNNWASALATTYEPPAENSLLVKIRDMTTFMN
ncbi:hypothetical protein Tco_1379472 [Tanacetum coccineum]